MNAHFTGGLQWYYSWFLASNRVHSKLLSQNTASCQPDSGKIFLMDELPSLAR
jgi:hypothetical protein